jgi:hypothetical protein
MEVSVSPIRDEQACDTAAVLLREGLPIGTHIRGVCGLWADGQQEDGVEAIYRIKGEQRGGRPLSTTLSAPAFIEKLDPDKISPSVSRLILDERELAARLGSLCFIRAPIRQEVKDSLPDRTVSQSDDGTYWIQNWLPDGCSSALSWMHSLRKANVTLPAATSMNISGEPEIVDQKKGQEFCAANEVPVFLADPQNPGRVRGSFPILRVDHEGITLIREGHFPVNLFRSLLSGWDIDLSAYQGAKFPVVDLPQEIPEMAAEPEALRQRLLEVLDG